MKKTDNMSIKVRSRCLVGNYISSTETVVLTCCTADETTRTCPARVLSHFTAVSCVRCSMILRVQYQKTRRGMRSASGR